MAPSRKSRQCFMPRSASVITETAAPSFGGRAMTLDRMTVDEKQIVEHARRDAIQACVLFGQCRSATRRGSGYAGFAPDEGGLGEPARSPSRRFAGAEYEGCASVFPMRDDDVPHVQYPFRNLSRGTSR